MALISRGRVQSFLGKGPAGPYYSGTQISQTSRGPRHLSSGKDIGSSFFLLPQVRNGTEVLFFLHSLCISSIFISRSRKKYSYTTFSIRKTSVRVKFWKYQPPKNHENFLGQQQLNLRPKYWNSMLDKIVEMSKKWNSTADTKSQQSPKNGIQQLTQNHNNP